MSVYIYTGLIVTAFAIVSYLLWWTYHLPKPTPGTGCQNRGWKWDSQCRFINEIAYDPSLSSPKGTSPYLIRFQNSPGAGPAIFAGCWYRFRYVNVLTGGYSEFSDWSNLPVLAGGCQAPCDPKIGCTFAQGISSCVFNQPTIGVNTKEAKYSPQTAVGNTYVYINLHRYVNTGNPTSTTPPPNDATDEIIGVMLAPASVGGEKYFSLIDVLNNPCKEGCNPPNVCNGGQCP